MRVPVRTLCRPQNAVPNNGRYWIVSVNSMKRRRMTRLFLCWKKSPMPIAIPSLRSSWRVLITTFPLR
ncbi:hypothetical protein EVA_15002 [gut metagenome]|uniref:Uncharacterized protein n=1 Tax=gut metagenome TaxID=749906 RepID=J9FPL5_9ZZZZ